MIADQPFDSVEHAMKRISCTLAGSFGDLADHAPGNVYDFLQDPHGVRKCSPHAALRDQWIPEPEQSVDPAESVGA